MIILKNCCCFNVRTGGIIIGWLGLIGGIISTLRILIFAIPYLEEDTLRVRDSRNEFINHIKEYGVTFALGLGVISILESSALLWGINKNNKLGLIPWLVTEMIKIVIILIITFGGGMYLLSTEFPLDGLIVHIVGILYGAFSFYYWCCILSIYNQMKLQETTPFSTGNEDGCVLTNNADPLSITNAPSLSMTKAATLITTNADPLSTKNPYAPLSY